MKRVMVREVNHTYFRKVRMYGWRLRGVSNWPASTIRCRVYWTRSASSARDSARRCLRLKIQHHSVNLLEDRDIFGPATHSRSWMTRLAEENNALHVSEHDNRALQSVLRCSNIMSTSVLGRPIHPPDELASMEARLTGAGWRRVNPRCSIWPFHFSLRPPANESKRHALTGTRHCRHKLGTTSDWALLRSGGGRESRGDPWHTSPLWKAAFGIVGGQLKTAWGRRCTGPPVCGFWRRDRKQSKQLNYSGPGTSCQGEVEMAGTRADQRDNDPAPSGGYPEAKLRECQECGVCIVFVVRYPELERFRWFSFLALRGNTAGRVHRGGSKAQATKVVSQNTPTFLVETFLTSGYRQRLLPPSSSIGWVPGLGTTSTTSATPRTRTNSASGDIIQRMPHPNPKSAPTTRRSFQQSEV